MVFILPCAERDAQHKLCNTQLCKYGPIRPARYTHGCCGPNSRPWPVPGLISPSINDVLVARLNFESCNISEDIVTLNECLN